MAQPIIPRLLEGPVGGDLVRRIEWDRLATESRFRGITQSMASRGLEGATRVISHGGTPGGPSWRGQLGGPATDRPRSAGASSASAITCRSIGRAAASSTVAEETPIAFRPSTDYGEDDVLKVKQSA